eukprot:CAMPEP_0174384652 /NCGR_PEP_ID=MMETSP0811_2-20130205/126062_1 /TAXON_ID=73025 ORGANISM="Eutreptiella gymnastica-like, Strain CCMP1594" /NCGR_SAMPLE_ID=MMETSP0811_2 /ASSEMBLY_ACC=CAM_ASM_000667 /LENGTH=118 /DNA_ID=CAMNT_0015538679 /DNA_START=725 /DNA_END=1081 /DNA_ORIENTATION=-
MARIRHPNHQSGWIEKKPGHHHPCLWARRFPVGAHNTESGLTIGNGAFMAAMGSCTKYHIPFLMQSRCHVHEKCGTGARPKPVSWQEHCPQAERCAPGVSGWLMVAACGPSLSSPASL